MKKNCLFSPLFCILIMLLSPILHGQSANKNYRAYKVPPNQATPKVQKVAPVRHHQNKKAVQVLRKPATQTPRARSQYGPKAVMVKRPGMTRAQANRAVTKTTPLKIVKHHRISRDVAVVKKIIHPKVNTFKAPIQKQGKKYRVRGKTYQVLPSSKGYHEKGIASWYGKPFHGRKTANGETYNMHNISAAHKSLPLNSVVKVKNLKNNKEITVKINDRGPFKGSRVIDLSYAAAKKLGMVEQGLAKVEIKAIS